MIGPEGLVGRRYEPGYSAQTAPLRSVGARINAKVLWTESQDSSLQIKARELVCDNWGLMRREIGTTTTSFSQKKTPIIVFFFPHS